MKATGLCAKALDHNISPYCLLVSFLFFFVCLFFLFISFFLFKLSSIHCVEQQPFFLPCLRLTHSGFVVIVFIYKALLFWGKQLTCASSELKSMYQVHCDPDGKLQMWIEVQLRLQCGQQKKKSQRASDKKRVQTNPTFFITHLCDFWQMTKKSGLHLKKVGDKCFKPHLATGVKHDRSNLVHNQLSIKVL